MAGGNLKTLKKKKVLSFGGCVQASIFSALQEYFEWKHVWRASVPTLTPQTIDLRAGAASCSGISVHPEVARFVEREATKISYRTLVDDSYDIIMFGIASDFNTSLVEVDGSYIVNPCNGILGEEFKTIDLEWWPSLSAGKIINPDSYEYSEIWKKSFNQLYESNLRNMIKSGTKILICEQYLCEHELVSGILQPIGGFDQIREMNSSLKERYRFAAKYDGMQLFKTPSALLFTSDRAPWGRWTYHPNEELLNYYRYKILKLAFPGRSFSESFLTSELQKAALQFDSAAAATVDAVRHREESMARLEEMQSRLQTTEAGLEASRASLAQLAGKLDEATCALEEASSQRDEFGMDLTRVSEQLECVTATLRIAHDEREKFGNLLLHHEADRRLLEAAKRSAPFWWRLVSLFVRSDRGRQRMERRLLKKAGFDKAAYLQKYDDVKASNIDPVKHYVVFGRAEGRLAALGDLAKK